MRRVIHQPIILSVLAHGKTGGEAWRGLLDVGDRRSAELLVSATKWLKDSCNAKTMEPMPTATWMERHYATSGSTMLQGSAATAATAMSPVRESTLKSMIRRVLAAEDTASLADALSTAQASLMEPRDLAKVAALVLTRACKLAPACTAIQSRIPRHSYGTAPEMQSYHLASDADRMRGLDSNDNHLHWPSRLQTSTHSQHQHQQQHTCTPADQYQTLAMQAGQALQPHAHLVSLREAADLLYTAANKGKQQWLSAELIAAMVEGAVSTEMHRLRLATQRQVLGAQQRGMSLGQVSNAWLMTKGTSRPLPLPDRSGHGTPLGPSLTGEAGSRAETGNGISQARGLGKGGTWDSDGGATACEVPALHGAGSRGRVGRFTAPELYMPRKGRKTQKETLLSSRASSESDKAEHLMGSSEHMDGGSRDSTHDATTGFTSDVVPSWAARNLMNLSFICYSLVRLDPVGPATWDALAMEIAWLLQHHKLDSRCHLQLSNIAAAFDARSKQEQKQQEHVLAQQLLQEQVQRQQQQQQLQQVQRRQQQEQGQSQGEHDLLVAMQPSSYQPHHVQQQQGHAETRVGGSCQVVSFDPGGTCSQDLSMPSLSCHKHSPAHPDICIAHSHAHRSSSSNRSSDSGYSDSGYSNSSCLISRNCSSDRGTGSSSKGDAPTSTADMRSVAGFNSISQGHRDYVHGAGQATHPIRPDIGPGSSICDPRSSSNVDSHVAATASSGITTSESREGCSNAPSGRPSLCPAASASCISSPPASWLLAEGLTESQQGARCTCTGGGCYCVTGISHLSSSSSSEDVCLPSTGNTCAQSRDTAGAMVTTGMPCTSNTSSSSSSGDTLLPTIENICAQSSDTDCAMVASGKPRSSSSSSGSGSLLPATHRTAILGAPVAAAQVPPWRAGPLLSTLETVALEHLADMPLRSASSLALSLASLAYLRKAPGTRQDTVAESGMQLGAVTSLEKGRQVQLLHRRDGASLVFKVAARLQSLGWGELEPRPTSEIVRALAITTAAGMGYAVWTLHDICERLLWEDFGGWTCSELAHLVGALQAAPVRPVGQAVGRKAQGDAAAAAAAATRVSSMAVAREKDFTETVPAGDAGRCAEAAQLHKAVEQSWTTGHVAAETQHEAAAAGVLSPCLEAAERATSFYNLKLQYLRPADVAAVAGAVVQSGAPRQLLHTLQRQAVAVMPHFLAPELLLLAALLEEAGRGCRRCFVNAAMRRLEILQQQQRHRELTRESQQPTQEQQRQHDMQLEKLADVLHVLEARLHGRHRSRGMAPQLPGRVPAGDHSAHESEHQREQPEVVQEQQRNGGDEKGNTKAISMGASCAGHAWHSPHMPEFSSWQPRDLAEQKGAPCIEDNAAAGVRQSACRVHDVDKEGGGQLGVMGLGLAGDVAACTTREQQLHGSCIQQQHHQHRQHQLPSEEHLHGSCVQQQQQHQHRQHQLPSEEHLHGSCVQQQQHQQQLQQGLVSLNEQESNAVARHGDSQLVYRANVRYVGF